jgi:hypothetical protein
MIVKLMPFAMEDKEKERDAQKEEIQGQWSIDDGLRFLKELREMPYDTSKVGQVFVTIHGKKLPYINDPEKEQERSEENND